MKKLLLIIPLIILGVGLLIYFGLLNKNAFNSSNKNAKEVEEMINSGGKFSSLLSINETMECEYSNQQSNFLGTYYTDGNNFSTTIIYDSEEKPLNVLFSDSTLYFWEEGDLVGTKISTNSKQDLIDEYDLSNQLSELNHEVSFKCEPWIGNEEVFMVPQEIDFVDINRSAEQVGTGVGGINQIQCAACDEYENFQDIASCKKALQCD